MFSEVFYQTMAQLCFTLLGLWWLVLQTKYREWIGNETRRRMATSISRFFLLPGTMGLLALLSDGTRPMWQIAFVVVSVAGIWETVRSVRGLYTTGGPRTVVWMRRLASLCYLAIVLVALFPDALRLFTGLAPLTVEGVLLTVLVVLGVNNAWVYFIEPAEEK